MSEERANEMKYFFCFRQIIPAPPGRWVVVGPFDTCEQAKAERDKAKARDAHVTAPFVAKDKVESQSKCGIF
ncbi:hypothetical protein [Bradyrhizobium genosp. P]|uniref:hypothetical protein n=1 Tax=Bradyrhizobium genosp. P TaxID=83641 RepID=UPI003CF95A49